MMSRVFSASMPVARKSSGNASLVFDSAFAVIAFSAVSATHAAARIKWQPTMKAADSISTTASPAAAPARNKTSAASSAMLAAVAAVLVLAGVLGWLDVRRDAQSVRADVAQRLTNTDAALAPAKARQSDLANQLGDGQAKPALLEA